VGKSVQQKNNHKILAYLENLTDKLPPQNWRDREQIKFQQFSTPHPVYRPQLPTELVATGKISQIQLDCIIYAGQGHSQ
jgi:hypothetical protein